jgi:hypothetical protein
VAAAVGAAVGVEAVAVAAAAMGWPLQKAVAVAAAMGWPLQKAVAAAGMDLPLQEVVGRRQLPQTASVQLDVWERSDVQWWQVGEKEVGWLPVEGPAAAAVPAPPLEVWQFGCCRAWGQERATDRGMMEATRGFHATEEWRRATVQGARRAAEWSSAAALRDLGRAEEQRAAAAVALGLAAAGAARWAAAAHGAVAGAEQAAARRGWGKGSAAAKRRPLAVVLPPGWRS